MRDSLTARAKEFNILVDDIAITHLSFGTEARAARLAAAACPNVVQSLWRCAW